MERPLVPCGGFVWAPGEPLPDLGHQGATPLLIAAFSEHREVVQQLINAGTSGGGGLKTSPPKVERGSRCRDLC